jgi:hypothetical protein
MGKKVFLGAAALLAGLSASSMASATTWEVWGSEGFTGSNASYVDWYNNYYLAGNYFVAGTTSKVNFNSNGSADYTIGKWLATGGITYSGANAGDSMDNTIWFVGTYPELNNAPSSVTVTHDDGVEVAWYQNNLQPGVDYTNFTTGGTAAITETGSCSGVCAGTGVLGITYIEIDGPPGVLTVNSIPEPSTWAMMGIGFAGLGFAAFRRAKAKAAFA